MLRSVKDLKGIKVSARDGDLGEVDYVYFDDDRWGVRYLVVETGEWKIGRRVLISPYSVSDMDPSANVVYVDLTQQQVREGPNIDALTSVSRQHETELLNYYGYPLYWVGPALWGVSSRPTVGLANTPPGLELKTRGYFVLHPGTSHADFHLRIADTSSYFQVKAADGEIGHVTDFVFDDEEWAIRYLTVDTRNWWTGGREVLLSTQWIDQLDSVESTISTTLTCDAVRRSPAYDDTIPLNRMYETQLHRFHERHGSWSEEACVGDAQLPAQEDCR